MFTFIETFYLTLSLFCPTRIPLQPTLHHSHAVNGIHVESNSTVESPQRCPGLLAVSGHQTLLGVLQTIDALVVEIAEGRVHYCQNVLLRTDEIGRGKGEKF